MSGGGGETISFPAGGTKPTKDTNPKDLVGIRKVPFSTIPMPVIGEIGLAMLEGARKYGRYNYREMSVAASVYYDAAMRHLTAWWEGENIDPESGLSHLAKALATLVVLRDGAIRDKMIDDRPIGTSGFIQAQNVMADTIIQLYPDAQDPFVGGGRTDAYQV